MDVVLDKWLYEMGTEEEYYSVLNDFGVTTNNDQDMIDMSLKQCLSSTYSTELPKPSSQILCFNNSSNKLQNGDSDDTNHKQSCLKFSSLALNVKREGNNYNYHKSKRTYLSAVKSPFHAQDHVLAERKRRENLGQRFIALSALIPGQKKTDKVSVLGNAIKYLKELQERVSTLEEQCKTRTMESIVLVKKSQLQVSREEVVDEEAVQFLPEIEARVLDEDVFIRIHCEKRKRIAAEILRQVEKLHLCALNYSAVPFGSFTLHITIVAKMDNQFNMSVKDLVKILRLSLY